MLAQPADQHWFISLNGKRYGPYTHAALTEAASRGVINSETLVWRLGWVNWHPAQQVPGLIDSPEEEAADLDEAEAEIFEGVGEHGKDPVHGSDQVVASADAPIDHELGKEAYEDGLPIGDDSEEHAPLAAEELAAEELAAEDVGVETSPAEGLTAEEFGEEEELDADRDAADQHVAGPQLRERHEPGIVTEEQEDAEGGIAPAAAERMFPRTAARGLSKELAFAPAAVRESTFEEETDRALHHETVDERPFEGAAAPDQDGEDAFEDEAELAAEDAFDQEAGHQEHAFAAVAAEIAEGRFADHEAAPRRQAADGGRRASMVTENATVEDATIDEDAAVAAATAQIAAVAAARDTGPARRGATERAVRQSTARDRGTRVDLANYRPSGRTGAAANATDLAADVNEKDTAPRKSTDYGQARRGTVGALALVSEIVPQRAAAPGAADLDEAWRTYFEDPPRSKQARRGRGDTSVAVKTRERVAAETTYEDLTDAVSGDEAVASASARAPDIDPSLDRPPTGSPPPAARRRWGFALRAAVGICVLLLLVAVGWGLFAAGLIVVVDQHPFDRAVVPRPPERISEAPIPAQGPSTPGDTVTGSIAGASDKAAGGALPQVVADLPAVASLRRTHPMTYDRFVKRFTEIAAGAPEDQYLSLARSALRRSIKRLLAGAPADTLLDITDTYLGYMQALQFTSPESCVALSDESKGATLTANLPKELPSLFSRDMAIIERVAAADPPPAAVTPTADQARPYLEAVFNRLRQQSVQSELLGRGKLAPAEFLPYCALVIAFYEAVLALPHDDRVNLLRYLYSAAADPDGG